MALWGSHYCGYWLGLPLCASAVRERVPGARFVALCPPFAWQTVPSTSCASALMPLAALL